MGLTELLVLALIAAVAAIDLFLWLTGRETISQMMTRLGRRHPWVIGLYMAVTIFLLFHFWPWLWPF